MDAGNPVSIYLEGERLCLCPLRREDAPQCTLWINDREIQRFLIIYNPVTLDAELAWLDEAMRAPREKSLILGIWLKEPRKLIGNIGLHDIDHRQQRAVLGILIGDKNEWNKGYGQEAIRLLVLYAFHTLNLRKVTLSVYANNPRAQAAYKALGFRETGRWREHRFIDGEWGDEILMELFRADFR